MQFVSGGSAIVEGGMEEAGKDVGKIQFQQELSRWFESRGVIADLRCHLRHLMITALQRGQVGPKPTDGASPKAQALHLMVAEYLFRHRCHYTLSVFTSEVPTLASFNLDAGPQGPRAPHAARKPSGKLYFQESEVEEILNALGLPSGVEELVLVKRRYLEKGNQASLVELFLQMTVELETKLQIRQNLEKCVVEGERVLSKEWSSKVVDVLLGEKVAPSQVPALEQTIFRITENEIRKTLKEQRESQLQMLYLREKRIQEYLRRHEDEILLRLMEAEKELTSRKEAIEEELTAREKHLTKMALEWNNKHEDILRLSKKFHSIENENRNFKKKLQELEEENRRAKGEEESQSRKIRELQEEREFLMRKLKEEAEANAILSERLQTLMTRESREANQATARGSVEIPLLWSKSKSLDRDSCGQNKEESGIKMELEESTVTPKKESVLPAEQWNVIELEKTTPSGAEPNKPMFSSDSSEEGEDVSLSSSFADIIHGVQEKLQFLEEESNRLNQSYLEYKLKCISVESDSESLNPSAKSPSPIHSEVCTVEAKFCQTNADETFRKIQKLKERKETKFEFDDLVGKKVDLSPKKPIQRTPTKRQLQHREFFLKSRHLVQQLEKQNAEELQITLSDSDCPTYEEELTASSKETDHESPVKSVSLTLLRTATVQSAERLRLKSKPPAETVRKTLAESSNQLLKSDADCLALLEEARIKTPQASARRPLRQQMLLSESDPDTNESVKEEEGTADFVKYLGTLSPRSDSSGKVSVGKKIGNDVV